MKIVHAVGWYFPESLGGTEVYVAGLCRHQRAHGDDIRVAAPLPGGAIGTTYEHEGTAVFRYPIPAEPTRDEAQAVVPARGAEQFHTWLADVRPDILHVHSFVTGLGLAEMRVAKTIGARIVVTHHFSGFGHICRIGTLMARGRTLCDGVAEERKCATCALIVGGAPRAVASAAALIPSALGRALGRVPGKAGTLLGMTASITRNGRHQRELMGLADRQVVLNHTARSIIAANGLPMSRVVQNRLGINGDLAERKPSPVEAPTGCPIRVGYMGRFHRLKGIYELVAAVRRLPADVPIVLEIRGPIRSSTEERVERELRGLAAGDPRIRFAPEVAHVDVARTLATWDVLCCLSQMFENGPTVALEALAVGTPVIGSRIGNLSEIIDDGTNGRLVNVGDIEGLSVALRDAAANPALTIDRWRLALSRPRTMRDVARDYAALYREILEDRMRDIA